MNKEELMKLSKEKLIEYAQQDRDFLKWLFSWELQARQPVLLNFVIENGEIHFISCTRKDDYTGVVEEQPEEETPETTKPKPLKTKQEEIYKGYIQ